jgi:hypothetical protein
MSIITAYARWGKDEKINPLTRPLSGSGILEVILAASSKEHWSSNATINRRLGWARLWTLATGSWPKKQPLV